jgi:hypothetical protein
MDAPAFQNSARDAAQLVFTEALARLASAAVQPGCDPEIAIKILNATKDVAQAVPKDKGDGFANLPVFHIHMHNGRITASAITPAVDVIEMSEAFETFDLAAIQPTEAMKAMADINKDLLAELEA